MIKKEHDVLDFMGAADIRPDLIPTMELRWLKLNTWSYRRDGNKGQDMAGTKNILQQKFIRQSDASDVWKDIPVVKASDVQHEWNTKP